MISLKGQTVLVTGGAVRVGAAISRAVAQAGATLAVHCHRHLDEARALARSLASSEAPAEAFQADLGEPEAPRRLFDEVYRTVGPVTALVNNAGLIAVTPLTEFDRELADRLMLLNAQVPIRMMAEMARRRPDSGVIVNVVDSQVTRAWKDHVAYVASKAALLAASRVAARELAPHIRVNVVNPGTVALRPDEQDRVGELLERIPLNRFGSPEDIGQAVVYLIGASYATGTVLDVDGGTRLM